MIKLQSPPPRKIVKSILISTIAIGVVFGIGHLFPDYDSLHIQTAVFTSVSAVLVNLLKEVVGL